MSVKVSNFVCLRSYDLKFTYFLTSCWARSKKLFNRSSSDQMFIFIQKSIPLSLIIYYKNKYKTFFINQTNISIISKRLATITQRVIIYIYSNFTITKYNISHLKYIHNLLQNTPHYISFDGLGRWRSLSEEINTELGKKKALSKDLICPSLLQNNMWPNVDEN